MDKPSRKIAGVSRFSGQGKAQPKPGSVRWYKEHIPERFNNTRIAVRNTGGFSDSDAEIIAARILKWNEGRQPIVNEELMRKAALFEKDKLAKYLQESEE